MSYLEVARRVMRSLEGVQEPIREEGYGINGVNARTNEPITSPSWSALRILRWGPSTDDPTDGIDFEPMETAR